MDRKTGTQKGRGTDGRKDRKEGETAKRSSDRQTYLRGCWRNEANDAFDESDRGVSVIGRTGLDRAMPSPDRLINPPFSSTSLLFLAASIWFEIWGSSWIRV